MKMRARRKFVFSSGDHVLEVRLSPAIVSFYALPAPAQVGPMSPSRIVLLYPRD
jgi:hypothetical protein